MRAVGSQVEGTRERCFDALVRQVVHAAVAPMVARLRAAVDELRDALADDAD